jgi:hypothetical protein
MISITVITFVFSNRLRFLLNGYKIPSTSNTKPSTNPTETLELRNPEPHKPHHYSPTSPPAHHRRKGDRTRALLVLRTRQWHARHAAQPQHSLTLLSAALHAIGRNEVKFLHRLQMDVGEAEARRSDDGSGDTTSTVLEEEKQVS